jgi:prevent-host-death family protein
MSSRLVSATQFKAHCLALLDEVQKHGGTIIVTKRGRPVASVSPAPAKPWVSPKGVWSTKVRIAGDIVNTGTARLWDVTRRD